MRWGERAQLQLAFDVRSGSAPRVKALSCWRHTLHSSTALPDGTPPAHLPLPGAPLQAYGISLGTMMCQRLLDAGAPGLHMYTLNLEKTAVAILENVGLIQRQPAAAENGATA